MHGWLILDKPTGITSAHAVAKVKRLLNPVSRKAAQDPAQSLLASQDLKIGHAGTLDPLASGILPLALGEATKTVPYMMDADKEYEFTVTWGEERDTDDGQGNITQISEKRPTQAEITAILPQFTGKIQQTPPDYSAIKIGGVRAYDAAREGAALELKAREVTVHSLQLSSWGSTRGSIHIAPTALTMDPRLCGDDSFICACSKGTYIRSLARDMGRKLGCFGHISALKRTRVGKFGQTSAISLEMLADMVHKGDLSFLRPVESALDDILARDIDANQMLQLKRGQAAILPRGEAGSTRVLARHNGRLVAICEAAEGFMKPVRVFNYE